MTIGHTVRPTKWISRLLCGLAATVLLAPTGSAASGQSWQDAIDYTKLKTRRGDLTPTGAGGVISMVEGQASGGASYVDVTSPEFNGSSDPDLAPVQFTDASGRAGSGQSNHALGVARHFFGDETSIARGANEVALYEAGHWLGNGALHYDNNGGVDTGAQPEPHFFRVQNHSWIVQWLNPVNQDIDPNNNDFSQERSALRRFDWLIEKDDVTEVVGVNNAGILLPHPALLVHSYNAIAVGRSDGFHSRGATNPVYGSGRFKPDIVAPISLVSHATPVVGSVAALLHESGAGTDAVKSETMKATLLAGATKQEFATFTDALNGNVSNPWDRTQTRPLDDIFGAGEVNAYNSYLIQLGGQHAGSLAAPTTTAGSYGWDYKDKTAADVVYYSFEIAEGSTAEELSVILAWNTKVTDTNSNPGTFTPDTDDSVQNLNLHLFNSTNAFLGDLVDLSVSTVDNVEHIYQTDLVPGTYTLRVTNAANWDYGLAWRMVTKFDQISADFDEDGVVSGSDLLAWQRNIGTLLGATHAQGDADGDGDVDADDLAAIVAGAIADPPPQVASARVSAIPEPTALAMAAAALLTAAGWSSRRRRRG